VLPKTREITRSSSEVAVENLEAYIALEALFLRDSLGPEMLADHPPFKRGIIGLPPKEVSTPQIEFAHRLRLGSDEWNGYRTEKRRSPRGIRRVCTGPKPFRRPHVLSAESPEILR
jgi:hypothetical protein